MMSEPRSNLCPIGSMCIRQLGLTDYHQTWEMMRRFTEARGSQTTDEIWCTEHPSVFTLGQAGRHEHILRETDIPIVRSDRGGQVTYHGPGQAVVYVLFDLKRANTGVKRFVCELEQAAIDVLTPASIKAERQPGAPGVYVAGAKVAQLGIRVRHGCTYHGIAMNVDMDLTPFSYINPCGYEGLEVTDLRSLGVETTVVSIGTQIAERIEHALSKVTRET